LSLDIAVINGKAGIFGDAALAIVRASGLLEKFKEWEEGTPYTDDWTFHCLMKRKGMPDERKGTWSWQDTIRAGFDKISPPSPWAKYTRRMMQFKCRNFPLRDEFGDVLKGMRLSEDNMDAIDMYPDATGAYEKPDEGKPQGDIPAKIPTENDEANQHTVFISAVKGMGLPPNMVEKFVKETAKANGLSVDKVEAEVMKDQVAFKVAAETWIKDRADDAPPEEVTLFDELKAMRPNTSDKNKGIFRALVLENIVAIRGWEAKDQDYLRLKWNNTFPDESFNGLIVPPEDKEEGRPPEPPLEDQGEGEQSSFIPKTLPPWTRRKNFLDEMKALHDKNEVVYFNTLGANGYESANDVPEDPDQEAMILSIVKAEIPGA